MIPNKATPSTPWRYAAGGAGPARELASQARVRAAHMSPYRTMTIATHDGRLLAAPAIVGAGQRPNQNVPGDVQIAPPSSDVQLMGSEFMQNRYREDGYRDVQQTPMRVNELDDYRLLPLVFLRPDLETGKRVMVQAREIGFTEAVPFQVPRLIGNEWLCIGGVLKQNQSLDDAVNLVEIRVENFHTTLTKGVIGIRFELAANLQNQAHWVTKAVFESQDLTGQAASTLGRFDKVTGIYAAGSVFCPLFSVNYNTGIVRDLGLQIPHERLNYSMKFAPPGGLGTLL